MLFTSEAIVTRDIVAATRAYEQWLGSQVGIVRSDLAYKHEQMAVDPFPFLRATYYRWAEVFPEVCPELARATRVLAVGDLHVENFGTWRDTEGRLVWGINDFDEASPLPFTNDLVRLATSARLAVAHGRLGSRVDDLIAEMLKGYRAGLKAGGQAFVLAEKNTVLRRYADAASRDPVVFWTRLEALRSARPAAASAAVAILERALPAPGLAYRLHRRRSGLGSLGRPRILALADWNGGHVAREAKPILQSAATLGAQSSTPGEVLYQDIVNQAVRVPDPVLHLDGGWVVRRLAPDCVRIELPSMTDNTEHLLLHAMGWETANVHLGTASAVAAIRADLASRPPGWLATAARAMARAVKDDFLAWRKSGLGATPKPARLRK